MGRGHRGLTLHFRAAIYTAGQVDRPRSYHEPYTPPGPSARASQRHLRTAANGDGTGVHQARVASRRLREAVPVLTEGLHGTKAGKARRKIRRLTRALGAVRELDVTLHLIDELGGRPGIPRPA